MKYYCKELNRIFDEFTDLVPLKKVSPTDILKDEDFVGWSNYFNALTKFIVAEDEYRKTLAYVEKVVEDFHKEVDEVTEEAYQKFLTYKTLLTEAENDLKRLNDGKKRL